MLGWGAAEAQVVTPTFRTKIANNSNYSVTLWNVSIMIDLQQRAGNRVGVDRGSPPPSRPRAGVC